MEVQSVRSEVKIGDLSIVTPYVKAFSVTRQRGTLWASASITLNLLTMADNIVSGDDIKIYATVDNDTKLLFTGYIDSMDVTPSMSKCGGAIITMTAYDKMYKLRLLKLNRRAQETPGEVWCAITGVTRKADNSTSNRFQPGGWSARTIVSGNMGDPDYDPLDAAARSKLSTSEERVSNKQSDIGDDAAPTGLQPGENVPRHAHVTDRTGGPALGIFGDYKLYEEEEEE